MDAEAQGQVVHFFFFFILNSRPSQAPHGSIRAETRPK